MDSDDKSDPHEDNRDAEGRRQSCHSTKKFSRESSVQSRKKNIQDVMQDGDKRDRSPESGSKTRDCPSDPDRDRVSDSERPASKQSFYSDDYEIDSRSEDSTSSYSRSQTPSPSRRRPTRAKGVSSNPVLKTGVCEGSRFYVQVVAAQDSILTC